MHLLISNNWADKFAWWFDVVSVVAAGIDRYRYRLTIVPHEQVVGIRRAPPDAVQLHEVVPLAVDVAADRHGRRDGLDVALVHEDLPRLLAQELHLRLRQGGARRQLAQPRLEVVVVPVGCGGGCRGGGGCSGSVRRCGAAAGSSAGRGAAAGGPGAPRRGYAVVLAPRRRCRRRLAGAHGIAGHHGCLLLSVGFAHGFYAELPASDVKQNPLTFELSDAFVIASASASDLILPFFTRP